MAMFKHIRRLWRAWEVIAFIRSFDPAAYMMGKLFDYVLGRLRLLDWTFVTLGGLLAVVWVLELVDWLVQLVLTILAGLGLWHGVWPQWPPLSRLAHPSFGSLILWVFSGIGLLLAALVWLFHFLRRLWPDLRTHAERVEAHVGGLGQGTFTIHSDGSASVWDGPMGHSAVHVRWTASGLGLRPRREVSRLAWALLVLGWFLQVLIFV
jgi:hypothetical protein